MPRHRGLAARHAVACATHTALSSQTSLCQFKFVQEHSHFTSRWKWKKIPRLTPLVLPDLRFSALPLHRLRPLFLLPKWFGFIRHRWGPDSTQVSGRQDCLLFLSFQSMGTERSNVWSVKSYGSRWVVMTGIQVNLSRWLSTFSQFALFLCVLLSRMVLICHQGRRSWMTLQLLWIMLRKNILHYHKWLNGCVRLRRRNKPKRTRLLLLLQV